MSLKSMAIAYKIRKLIKSASYNSKTQRFTIEFQSSQKGLRELAKLCIGGSRKNTDDNNPKLSFPLPEGIEASELLSLLDIVDEVKTR